MNSEINSYKIVNGRLTGPTGSWSLKSLSGVYKTEGGQLSMAKYLLVLAGITAAGAAVTMGAAAVFILGGGSMAYFVHRTRNVMIVSDGVEIEIYNAIYFSGIWNDDESDKQCDELVALISQRIK